MLILTKKYELIEINNTKAIITIAVLSGLAFCICNYVTSIPDAVNLVIGIPLSILSTFLWEYFVNRKNRVFDEQGLQQILYGIATGNKNFVETFILKFIKVHASHKTFLKLNQANTIEEIYLLCLLIEPSFWDLRNHLMKPEEVESLFNSLNKNEFELTKDYGINFQNLAFFYEINCSYLYYYYGIGSPVNLHYNLENENLLIQKSFFECPIVDPETYYINENFNNHPHPFKKEYEDLYIYFFDSLNSWDSWKKDRVSTSDYFHRLYSLFCKVKNNEDFQTLEIFLAFDMIMLFECLGEYAMDIDDILKKEKKENTEELVGYLYNSLKKSALYFYLYESLTNINYYLDNIDNFSLHENYNYDTDIYFNQGHRYIVDKDFANLEKILIELESMDNIINPYSVLQRKCFRVLHDYFVLGVPPNIPVEKGPAVGEKHYSYFASQKLERIKLGLGQLPTSTPEEIDVFLMENYLSDISISLLKDYPLFFRQTFQKIGRFIK